MSYPKTFCPLPWLHQASYTDGSLLLCCVSANDSKLNLNRDSINDSFNSKYWRNIRKAMMAGERPASCQRCWIEEENKYKSLRLHEIEVWEQRLGKQKLNDLLLQTQADGRLLQGPISMDLRIGNTCNLQCVMCRPHDSKKWLGLSQKLATQAKTSTLKKDMNWKNSIDLKNYDWQDNELVWSELRDLAPTLQQLIIGGGEPMLLNGHFEFLKYCVDNSYASRIVLRYHTNLTVLNRDHIGLWKHFKEVQFFASIDGLREQNHYLRYPAEWSAIESNLNYLDKVYYNNINVMILFSAHFLSLYNLVDFAKWVEGKNFKKINKTYGGNIHPGIVMQPEYLSPRVLPPPIKQKITEKILTFESQAKNKSNKLSGLVSFMNEKDESHHLPAVLEYINLLDKNRNTNFAETFPEFYDALKPYFSDSRPGSLKSWISRLANTNA
ncbi:MAG: twitch domain-containing radical SAM protein [Bdellovibrionales bacterium]|nr:twitch domain-containing radical SAM protein [Bdellovibrionales bacterium]